MNLMKEAEREGGGKDTKIRQLKKYPLTDVWWSALQLLWRSRIAYCSSIHFN